MRRTSKTRMTWRLALSLVGAGAVLAAIASGAFGSPSSQFTPTLTATQASFVIPAQPAGNWVMRLWTMPQPTQMISQTGGTSGTLTLDVPHTSSCEFQVDVRHAPVDSQNYTFYSGLIATVPGCGGDTTTTTTTSTTTTTTVPLVSTTTTPGVPTAGDGGSALTADQQTAPSAGALAATGPGLGTRWTALIGVLLVMFGAALLVRIDAPRRSLRRLVVLAPSALRHRQRRSEPKLGRLQSAGGLLPATRRGARTVASRAVQVANWTMGR